MKGSKFVKFLIVFLVVLMVSIIAFIGIFKEKNGVFENIVPKFTLGMDLNGDRELRYVLDDSSEEKEVYVDDEGNIKGEVPQESEDEAESTISLDDKVEDNKEAEVEEDIPYKKEKRVVRVNPEEKKLEDFENTKKVIQERLSKNKNIEYNLRLDTLKDNELILEVPNDDDKVDIVRTLTETKGEFKVIDEEKGYVLLDNSGIKTAQVAYGRDQQDQTKIQVYLQVTLNKEGHEKFTEISKKYIASTDENGEDNTPRHIAVYLDDTEILHTAFKEEYTSNLVQFPIGQSSEDYETYTSMGKFAESYATILKSGTLPLVYKLQSDNYIQSSITSNIITASIVLFVVAVLVISIVFILRYKFRGFMAAILNVGYIALVVIAARYSDIVVTLNSSLAFIGCVVLNVVFLFKYLEDIRDNKNEKEAFLDTFKEVYSVIIPVIIIAIIFTCLGNMTIASIGTVLFWGILIHIVYSFLVEKHFI